MVSKSNEQTADKIGKFWTEKRSNYFNRMIKHNFKAAYYHCKDQYTLIEQSPVTSTAMEQTPLTKYPNKAVINACEVGKM